METGINGQVGHNVLPHVVSVYTVEGEHALIQPRRIREHHVLEMERRSTLALIEHAQVL